MTNIGVRVVLAGDFVRANADGKANLESMRELARRLTHVDREAGQKPILLDVRQLTGALSFLDVVNLIDEMLQSRADYRTRLALLVRDDQAQRARFMETYARNRSVPIGAFTDVAEAVRWLSDAANAWRRHMRGAKACPACGRLLRHEDPPAGSSRSLRFVAVELLMWATLALFLAFLWAPSAEKEALAFLAFAALCAWLWLRPRQRAQAAALLERRRYRCAQCKREYTGAELA